MIFHVSVYLVKAGPYVLHLSASFSSVISFLSQKSFSIYGGVFPVEDEDYRLRVRRR